MDTMTITKAGGAICGSLLIALLGLWFAEGLYHSDTGHGEEHAAGYAIIVESEDAGADVDDAVPEAPFEEVYVNASADAGERLWRQCSACHQLEAGANATGPYLHGVVGRAKHSVDGYDYSDALLSQDGEWTPENISAFLENPREYAPGTKMAYRGMEDVEDRANLIAYLATFGG
ncbi:cytochrome c family protein [uncultured Jannaschia sp.]|uniref:c-type cytochrome n=1 Tax=uncultured Jannaschia sp. TaxID=293347 RepID=UPI002627E11F|nr:cytochrome c family protein [uncultured Jannaschia sp.]